MCKDDDGLFCVKIQDVDNKGSYSTYTPELLGKGHFGLKTFKS